MLLLLAVLALEDSWVHFYTTNGGNKAPYIETPMLWQPLVTKTNSNTSNKSLSRISMWGSQENSTRSFCYISILFIQKSHGPC